jgi:hypothetical protein
MPDDPRQMTSTEMRTEAAELERVAKSYLERAKQLREVAALVDGLAKHPVIDPHTVSRPAFPGPLHDAPPDSKKGRLPSNVQYDTLDAMNTSEIDTRRAIAGRKFTTKHPLTAKAKAMKTPIKDVAEQLSKKLKRTIPRTTVRSWYAPKDSGDGRPIPEDAVRFFEADPWNIPRAAWKNGISES